MAQVSKSGQQLELVLFKNDTCPFCLRVMSAVAALGLAIPVRDTRTDPRAKEDLVKLGGKSQVPMLLINGQPLYESADIVRFLETEVQAQ